MARFAKKTCIVSKSSVQFPLQHSYATFHFAKTLVRYYKHSRVFKFSNLNQNLNFLNILQ